jgi:hypothetical protein
MLAGGQLTLTITSLASGEHMTLTYRSKTRTDGGWNSARLEDASFCFVGLHSTRERIGTYYPKTGTFRAVQGADPRMVWGAMAGLLAASGKPHAQARFQEESRCGICSRELTDPVSIDRGIGPECYAKQTGSQHIRHAS